MPAAGIITAHSVLIRPSLDIIIYCGSAVTGPLKSSAVTTSLNIHLCPGKLYFASTNAAIELKTRFAPVPITVTMTLFTRYRSNGIHRLSVSCDKVR